MTPSIIKNKYVKDVNKKLKQNILDAQIIYEIEKKDNKENQQKEARRKGIQS